MKKKNYNIPVRSKYPVKLIKEGKNFKCEYAGTDALALCSASLKKLAEEIKTGESRQDNVNALVNLIEMSLHVARLLGMTSTELKCKVDQANRVDGDYNDDIILKWVEENE